MIAKAIEQAVADGTQSNKSSKPNKNKPAKSKAIHVKNMTADVIEGRLKELVLEKYGSATAFFNAASKEGSGIISRKDFKAAIRRLGLDLSDASRKVLRKKVACDGSKCITLQLLTKFIEGDQPVTKDANKDTQAKAKGAHRGLAPIPSDVPALPPNFQPRGAAQDALLASLVQITESGSTVSLTAPKSRSNKVLFFLFFFSFYVAIVRTSLAQCAARGV